MGFDFMKIFIKTLNFKYFKKVKITQWPKNHIGRLLAWIFSEVLVVVLRTQ